MISDVVYLGSEEGYEAACEALRGLAEVSHSLATNEAVSEGIRYAAGILDASMRVTITDEMVAAAPRLKVISCATTGSDHIQRAELARRKIPVFTLKEDAALLKNLTPAAELSWALVMALARRLIPAVEHTREGRWVREEFPGMMLNGRTLGLVGCGRIGGWMARYAHGFGMSVIAYDPWVRNLPAGVKAAALDEIFSHSDVVSVHVHLTEETYGLVSKSLLQSCKRGMLFINTSRGAVVDEAALLDALLSGRVGGAGLDVLNGEPDVSNHPLIRYARQHDNLYVTPHCGGFSPDAVRIVCRCAAEKIAQILSQ